MKLTKLNILLIAIVALLSLLLLYSQGQKESSAIAAPIAPTVVTKEVPAKIPDEYQKAMDFFNKFRNFKSITNQDEYLKSVKKVQVVVDMDDNAKTIIDETTIKTKIELGLRQAGLTVVENNIYTPYIVYCNLNMLSKNNPLCIYLSGLNLYEYGLFLRSNGTTTYDRYRIWQVADSFGSVGISNARESFIKTVQENTEIFINAWLGANPKETATP